MTTIVTILAQKLIYKKRSEEDKDGFCKCLFVTDKAYLQKNGLTVTYLLKKKLQDLMCVILVKLLLVISGYLILCTN